ncbi:MAG: hypothetical protein F7B06_02275, partial [Opitutae bacterium]|nr:hypothetical protein [Opitutae bacterium]
MVKILLVTFHAVCVVHWDGWFEIRIHSDKSSRLHRFQECSNYIDHMRGLGGARSVWPSLDYCRRHILNASGKFRILFSPHARVDYLPVGLSVFSKFDRCVEILEISQLEPPFVAVKLERPALIRLLGVAVCRQ